MSKWLVLFCGIIIFFLSLFIKQVYPDTGNGEPLKYISSCQIDLNNDDKPDIALLVETVRGWELIVLMKTEKAYNAFVVSEGKEGMYLSCHFGEYIKETMAGKGHSEKARVFKTPGTYIELTQPECCSAAYFWNGNGFTEVVTAD